MKQIRSKIKIILLFNIYLLFNNMSCQDQQNKKFKVGLCITATNKYIIFVEPLIKSAKKYFLPNHDVTFFIFTDKDFKLDKDLQKNLVIIYQKHVSWPFSSMQRFETYFNNKRTLSEMDYLFACDADMLFVDYVSNDILDELVGVLHPFFWNNKKKACDTGVFNDRRDSTAYLSGTDAKHYFAGGFYGGCKEEFFKLLSTNMENIKKNTEKNIIAKEFDEGHLNRYFFDNPPTKILGPSYCYPQFFSNQVFKPILIALDKNHDAMRS